MTNCGLLTLCSPSSWSGPWGYRCIHWPSQSRKLPVRSFLWIKWKPEGAKKNLNLKHLKSSKLTASGGTVPWARASRATATMTATFMAAEWRRPAGKHTGLESVVCLFWPHFWLHRLYLWPRYSRVDFSGHEPMFHQITSVLVTHSLANIIWNNSEYQ